MELPYPAELHALATVDPFAVEYRCDLLEDGVQPPLDRATMRDLVRCLRSWATSTTDTARQT